MIRLARAAAVAAILVAAPAAALAQVPGPIAVGAQVGTPGLGANIQFALNDMVVLRGGYDVLQWDRDDSYQDVDYNAEIDFKSPGAFVDLHPFRNSFFVSGGAYFGERGVDLDATPTRDVRIGGVTFTPAQVGRLDGRIDLEDTAPFAGIGFDNTITRGGRLGFRFTAGAVFGDAPVVNLQASGGTFSDNPIFQERLRQEEAEI